MGCAEVVKAAKIKPWQTVWLHGGQNTGGNQKRRQLCVEKSVLKPEKFGEYAAKTRLKVQGIS